MTVKVSVRRTYYALVKPLIERDALALQARRPWLHLADCCQRVIARRPTYWRVYKHAMKVGCASEFQRPKPRPSRPTAVDRVWFEIEGMARTLVAASSEPLTLRSAVVRLVDAQPELVDRYRRAILRMRRDRAGRPKRRPALASRGRTDRRPG